MRILTCVFLVALVSCGDASTILFHLGYGAVSHKNAVVPLAQELQSRGHRVIHLNAHPSTTKRTYEDMVPEKFSNWYKNLFVGVDRVRDRIERGFVGVLFNLPWMWIESCKTLLETDEYRKFVTKEITVDLIIIDPLCSECALGLAQHLDVPFIYFCTTGLYPYITAPLGMPSTAVYKAGLTTAKYTDVRQFLHRLVFVLDGLYFTLMRKYIVFPRVEDIWEKRFGRPMTSLEEYEKNLSLVFTNAVSTTELPMAVTPNVIDVGGMHLVPNKTLPEELKKIADKTDFVYFSLGSAVSVKSLPEHLLNSFLQSFKKLKQTVLWKTDAKEEDLRGRLPANVHIFKWLPQNDLLAHPNCKLFITHGGKLSTTETINYGVPVLVIPFFADQDGHAQLAEDNGFGIRLDVSHITEETLYPALVRILSEPEFKRRAVQLMKAQRDQLHPPLERAVYWVEYVLRHNGAAHLRPYARHLTWWQYHLVDVWLVIGTVLITILLIVVFILKSITRLACGADRKKAKKD